MTMHKKRLVIVSLAVLTAIVAFAVFLLCRFTIEIPTECRLADLSIVAEREIQFRPEHYPPYHLLIGSPNPRSGVPRFSGTILITDSNGSEFKIPIDSASSQESNWLQRSTETGYILTWGHQPRLDKILKRGAICRLRISFNDPPPSGCSLWFFSMQHSHIF